MTRVYARRRIRYLLARVFSCPPMKIAGPAVPAKSPAVILPEKRHGLLLSTLSKKAPMILSCQRFLAR
jgi:hypothetical protein